MTPRGQSVALTFDDGPSEPFTRDILASLARHGIRATFFLIGAHCERLPEIARLVAAHGHAIGNHSYSHSLFSGLDFSYRDAERAQLVIEKTTGVRPDLFRPPYGILFPWHARRIRALGLSVVRWTFNPADYRARDPQELSRRVVSGAAPGDVLLLHDGRATGEGADRIVTAKALPSIIDGLIGRGFGFATPSEMTRNSGVRSPAPD